jgi:hypothetical protein
MMPCSLRHEHLREIVEEALFVGYRFETCAAVARNRNTDGLLAVLRHDVDITPELAPPIAALEADLGISTTFFFRVHANEYNAFSHENLAIMRDIAGMGHEVGLHVEPIDLRASCGVDPALGIRTMATALGDLIGVPVTGVACHGDITPDNNLDYFQDTSAADLGLVYEAYDDDGLDLFGKSWYITDGHFWKWRAFENGTLTDNQECLCKHVGALHTPLYSLVHPHVWYSRHPHRIRY